ncbi:MAG TPA: dynamin family protein [Hyphomicrobiaceae bacterium]|nr:dynamin family protein [Hyphomicrobiaceae bacterium]
MGFEAPSQLHGGDARRVQPFNRQADAPCQEPIGAPLERARLRIAALLNDLEGMLGEHAAPLLREARRQIDERACRIAVIGQIKAGKTTFINTLIGQPGLLPTDINPWTAVVSALHFRSGVATPEHAAVFQLFSIDEWKQIAKGGGRLRELTERLVPGFQPDLLRAQLEVMRSRSERRLGAKFEQLLGKSHRFKTITPELLADYISAGDPNLQASTTEQRRNYSDITRSADLYFDDSPFAFPITLIDTPGTNDPFLVRDEITRRSLENPDIYIFVLSALQPLSAADVAMIRLLNGLHKDRIIVFINRVDQLANPGVDATIVRRSVKKRLRLEFPNLHIPVISGSAWLGGLEMSSQPASGKEAQFSALVAGSGSPFAAPALATGMSEVAAAITQMMCNSTIAVLLQQIASCLLELVRSDQAGVSAQLQQMQMLFEAERTEVNALQKKIAEEEAALAAFEARAHALRASFEEMQAHFDRTIESGQNMLRSELRSIVRDFAQTSADRLAAAIENGVSTRSWRCNVTPLRSDLETAYLTAFDDLARDVVRVEQFLYPQLQVIVSNLLPGYRGTVLEAPEAPLAGSLSLSALSDRVTMDLDTHWWTHWFRARRSAHEHGNQLRILIENDFLPIVEQLVGDAVDSLRQRIEYTMQRASAIASGLLSGVEQRRQNLAVQAAPLRGSDDVQSAAHRQGEQIARIQKCLEQQATLTASCEELESILAGLDGLQSESARR